MKKARSIPKELIEDKFRKIRKKHSREEIDRTAKDDWIEAKEYLEKHYLIVIFWWKVNAPVRSLRNFWSLFRDVNSRDFALDIVKTVISAFGLAATIFAGVGLFLNYQGGKEDRKLTQEQLGTAQERLITERFAKAVEQLGKDKDTTVRVGGIYALERIAKDSPKDHWTIMEVLTSYVRENSSLPPELKQIPQNEQEREERQKELEKLSGVSIDVQAILTVIRRREDPERDREERIDLSFTNLKGADLIGADLYRANLIGADLRRAYLIEADLRLAVPFGAVLSRAYLRRADLGGADLRWADLNGADLLGADLNGADLDNAKLIEARSLTPTQIKSACNWSKAIYKLDKSENLKYIEQLKQDKASDPRFSPDCPI